MDGARFDDLVRALLAGASRRVLLRLSALSLAGGLAALLLDDESEAKKRKNKNKKKRKRKKKKHKPKETCVCASGCPFTSVQDAIDAAGNGDTITLCAGTFVGNLTIDKDLTIVGAGEDATTLQGDGAGTVVAIAGPFEEVTTVIIKQLRITGGAAEFGGGIFNSDTLTLSGCTVSGNTAGNFGGGIENLGTVSCTNGSTVSDNVPDQCVDETGGSGCDSCTPP